MTNRGRIKYYHISWHLASQDYLYSWAFKWGFLLVSTVLIYVRKIFLSIHTATVDTRHDVVILSCCQMSNSTSQQKSIFISSGNTFAIFCCRGLKTNSELQPHFLAFIGLRSYPFEAPVFARSPIFKQCRIWSLSRWRVLQEYQGCNLQRV